MASGWIDSPPVFDLGDDETLIGCPGGSEFRARFRDDASVVWLNRGWFVEHHGWDIHSHRDGEQASRWILQRFAYELEIVSGAPVRAEGKDASRYTIDGYGTTSLARYGGSGRAGVTCGFQVKGIGRTPFAASNADWHHSHGFLWLEEGLREAIFSEVCRSEAPCGAVPVVAVIALEENTAAPDGSKRQRALLVRPFRARPAHLQRALLLERPDLDGPLAAHMQDVARVRWHVERLQTRAGGVWNVLRLLIEAYGRQAAYSHVSGWFNGGLTSSNLTLKGEFIDFGSARFVPDGRASTYEVFGQRFGDELETAAAVLASVAFYVRKYAGAPAAAIDLDGRLMSAYGDQLVHSVSSLLGAKALPTSATQLAAVMERAFARIRRMNDGAAAIAEEEAAMEDCARVLARDGGLDPAAAVERWRAIRFRPNTCREAVQSQIERWLWDDPKQLQARVDHLVARHTLAALGTVGG